MLGWLRILRGRCRLLQISTCLCALKHRADGLHQIARGLHAEFHRHARSWTKRLVHKIDIQRMFQRRIEWVVIRHVCLAQCEPPTRSFAAPIDVHLCDDHGTHTRTPYTVLSAASIPSEG